jgi:hypothetical protein
MKQYLALFRTYYFGARFMFEDKLCIRSFKIFVTHAACC